MLLGSPPDMVQGSCAQGYIRMQNSAIYSPVRFKKYYTIPFGKCK